MVLLLGVVNESRWHWSGYHFPLVVVPLRSAQSPILVPEFVDEISVLDLFGRTKAREVNLASGSLSRLGNPKVVQKPRDNPSVGVFGDIGRAGETAVDAYVGDGQGVPLERNQVISIVSRPLRSRGY